MPCDASVLVALALVASIVVPPPATAAPPAVSVDGECLTTLLGSSLLVDVLTPSYSQGGRRGDLFGMPSRSAPLDSGCVPPEIDVQCVGSGLVIADYGFVASQITGSGTFTPTFNCGMGQQPTVDTWTAAHVFAEASYTDSVSVTSGTLPSGTPVDIVATMTLETSGATAGVDIAGESSEGSFDLAVDFSPGGEDMHASGLVHTAGPLVVGPGAVTTVSIPSTVGATIDLAVLYRANTQVVAAQALPTAVTSVENQSRLFLDPDTADVLLVAASGHDYATGATTTTTIAATSTTTTSTTAFGFASTTTVPAPGTTTTTLPPPLCDTLEGADAVDCGCSGGLAADACAPAAVADVVGGSIAPACTAVRAAPQASGRQRRRAFAQAKMAFTNARRRVDGRRGRALEPACRQALRDDLKRLAVAARKARATASPSRGSRRSATRSTAG